MALIKTGGGLSAISGSIAGNTFARNRSGYYMRNRTKPVNPRTGFQTGARTTLAMLSELWHESPMTAAIRTAWDTYSEAIAWKNRLGETIHLTGFTHFLRSNASRLRAGLTIVTAAPTVLELPEQDNSVVISASVAANKLSVIFNNTLPWAGVVGGAMSIQMGRPLSPTRNFCNGPWRYSGKILGAVVPPTSPQLLDPAFTLVAGQKVWCSACIIRLDGRVSTRWVPAPFVITA